MTRTGNDGPSHLVRDDRRYRELYEAIDAGFCVIEVKFNGDHAVDYRFLEVNPAFADHTGLCDVVGRWMRDIAPELEQHWCDRYGRVARTGKSERFELPAKAVGDRWFEVDAYPIGEIGSNEVAILFNDVSARKRSEIALIESEARWRGLFTGMSEGFFIGELIRDENGKGIDYRFIEINPAFEAQSGLPSNVIGTTILDHVPAIAKWQFPILQHVVDTGEPQSFEASVPELHRIFEVRCHKNGDQRFGCLFLDITARREDELRRRALSDLSDLLRDTSKPDVMAATSAEIMGRVLGLSHAGYGSVNPAKETVDVIYDHAAEGVASLGGRHTFRDYGSYIDDMLAGNLIIINDIEEDSRTRDTVAALHALSVRSLFNIPVMEHGRFVALMFATRATPTIWTDEEIAFLRDVTDRTRAAIARAETDEKQHVVNHEISHRMKNMLTIVQAITSQSLRGAVDIQEAKKVLIGRIMALGAANDILMGGTETNQPLQVLIEHALVAHNDRTQRIICDGPEVMVGAKAALSITMVLHELATNAVKYGALSNEDGYVTINWTITNSDDPSLILKWVEAGGPPIEGAPGRKGFGSRLITRGFAGSVQTDLAFPRNGAECTIETPLGALFDGQHL